MSYNNNEILNREFVTYSNRIKNWLILIVFSIFKTNSYAQTDTLFHIGKWATSNSEIKSISFDEEGYVCIISKEVQMGGKHYFSNGKLNK